MSVDKLKYSAKVVDEFDVDDDRKKVINQSVWSVNICRFVTFPFSLSKKNSAP